MERPEPAEARKTPLAPHPRDGSVLGPDGRRVGYRLCGADATPRVLYLHGAPGSRAEGALYDRELAAAGVAAVAVDRAGYGLTDPAEGFDLVARCRDALRVTDSLGMDRFSVIGVSAGGPYALGCAVLAPTQVDTVVLVAGQGRLDTPWALEDMQPDFRDGWAAEMADWEAAREESEIAMAALVSGDRVVDHFLAAIQDFPAEERALVDEAETVFADDLLEATRQGGVGYWLDGATRSQPWPFEPSAVTSTVHVFHGARDTWNPLTALRRSLAGAPHVVEHVLEGGNHLAPHATAERRRSVVTALAPNT